MHDDSAREKLNAQTLEEIETLLLKRHKELAEDLHVHGRAIRQQIPGDSEDALSVKEEIELVEKEDKMEEDEIHLVEDALQRIADNTFGLCLDCGSAIPVERLRVVPYARYCVLCAEKMEKENT